MTKEQIKALEVWKPVPGYEGLYEVSSMGSVRSKLGLLKPTITPTGYLRVALYKQKSRKNFVVHRIVAIAFLQQNGNPMVCHKDGNKVNNNFENLYWGTHADNVSDSARLKAFASGEDHGCAKLNRAQIAEIKKLYIPKHRTYSLVKLSKKYGVHVTTLSRIIRGKNWK